MKPGSDRSPRFREEQCFRQPWLWALVLGGVVIEVIVAVSFARGMIQQLVRGEPWGDEPMSDTSLAVVGGLVLLQGVLLGIGLPWLFYALKLITEVRADGLLVHFFPFRRRWITYDQIQRCAACTYSPMVEYGGWGIRWAGRGKWAYNVSGNRGVQLELAGNKRLLIGSQRPEDLAAAIRAQLSRG